MQKFKTQGERLRYHRIKSNLSKYQLAQMLCISAWQYEAWEKTDCLTKEIVDAIIHELLSGKAKQDGEVPQKITAALKKHRVSKYA